MQDKIKIAWICHLTNNQIREHLQFDNCSLRAIIRRLANAPALSDFAAWNSNAIKEFEHFEDIELHVISPHPRIAGVQEFQINGIYYHFFSADSETFLEWVQNRLQKKEPQGFVKNSRIICTLIEKIQPEIIHMIGAENPYYGESALLLPRNIPFIITPQTLLADPAFFDNYYISQAAYNYRAKIEKEIIQRADYIGTQLEHFRTIICDLIKPDAKFLDMTLAVGEDVSIQNSDKQYDFVYFAINISKAVDYAIEAFTLAQKRSPNITLHIVGGYDSFYKNQLDLRIAELELKGIDFTGELPTRDDVIIEIQKARFALLPLKIDLISGTIREAMAHGLPVVTTITPATPSLNESRQSVLLSAKGDYQAMADNMCALMESDVLAMKLQENAFITLQEQYDNTTAMKKWVEAYKKIL